MTSHLMFFKGVSKSDLLNTATNLKTINETAICIITQEKQAEFIDRQGILGG